MAKLKVWVETTRAGTFQVRYQEPNSTDKLTYISIGKHDAAVVPVDGEEKSLVGKSLAKYYRDQFRDRYHAKRLGAIDHKAELPPLLEKFVTELEGRNSSTAHVKHSEHSITRFLVETKAQSLGDLAGEQGGKDNAGTEHIKNWRNAMTKAGLANSTIRGRLADVRNWCTWLTDEGYLKVNPFGKGVMPKAKDPEPRYYLDEEWIKLDDTMADISHEARLGINLAHSCGLRKCEFAGHLHNEHEEDELNPRSRVCYEDITWRPDGSAELLLRKEVVKGGARSRTVELDPGIIALLGSRKSGPLVTLTRFQFDHLFQRAREKSGIPQDLDVHGLRHTFAKNFLQRGNGNLKALKDALGHASIATTQIYAQFEKSYMKSCIYQAYQQRLIDEQSVRAKLAGRMQGEIEPTQKVAGRMQGAHLEIKSPSGAVSHGVSPARSDKIARNGEAN